MDELVRCNSCRGSKKVAKLGGMIGECNTCKGAGRIKPAEKCIYVAKELEIDDKAVILQVSEAVIVSDAYKAANKIMDDNVDKPEIIKAEFTKVANETLAVKMGNRTIYKRKKS